MNRRRFLTSLLGLPVVATLVRGRTPKADPTQYLYRFRASDGGERCHVAIPMPSTPDDPDFGRFDVYWRTASGLLFLGSTRWGAFHATDLPVDKPLVFELWAMTQWRDGRTISKTTFDPRAP